MLSQVCELTLGYFVGTEGILRVWGEGDAGSRKHKMLNSVIILSPFNNLAICSDINRNSASDLGKYVTLKQSKCMYAAVVTTASNWTTEIHFCGTLLYVLQVDVQEFLRFKYLCSLN
jgi:hypothetical protein